MVTDPPPRGVRHLREYEASDLQTDLVLPDAAALATAARALCDAMPEGKTAPVKKTGSALLKLLANTYDVPEPPLVVLGARPHQVLDAHTSYELVGDYMPDSHRIRVWMRTAILGKVTSYRGLLNTLLHEFCHHLDMHRLGFGNSWHTRGFFARVDHLYHLALETPPEKRKPLHWRKRGSIWIIDWTRMRSAGRA